MERGGGGSWEHGHLGWARKRSNQGEVLAREHRIGATNTPLYFAVVLVECRSIVESRRSAEPG
jgi:hypothetical protein